MPGWLMWALIGLGAWCAGSVPLALFTCQLLGHGRTPRRRAVVTPSPKPVPLGVRGRPQTLTRSG
jgi:hypothetical protein